MSTRTFLVLCILTLRLVRAYPNGAPESACSDMMPQHRNSVFQSTRPPYSVTFSRTSYTLGSNVTIAISGNTIKGYLIEARRTNLDLNTVEVVGSFVTSSRSKTICQNARTGWNGLTHSREIEVQTVQMTWKAPKLSDGPQGNVKFRITVVNDFAVFWLITSPEITGDNPPSTVAPTAASAGGGAAIAILPPVYLGECGAIKSCLLSPASCVATAQCGAVATWKSLGGLRIKFELQSLGGAAYVAIGFSPTGLMAQSSIVACKLSSTGDVVAEQLYSSSYTGVSAIGRSNIANVTGAAVGSRLTCGFVWINDPLIRTSGQAYDLQQPYFVVVAKGPVTGDQIKQHSEYPEISTTKLSIFGTQLTINGLGVTGAPSSLLSSAAAPAGSAPTAVAASAATPTSTSSAAVVRSQPNVVSSTPAMSTGTMELGCGTTKSCYVSPIGCAGAACNYLITWARVGASFIRIELQTAGAADYVSMGFSGTQSMVQASIVACVRDSVSGSIDVQQLYSADYVTPGRTSLTSVFNISGSVNGGILSCSATWDNDLAQRSLSELYDLRTAYYILLARGRTAGTRLLKHTEAPIMSATKLILLSNDITLNGSPATGLQAASSAVPGALGGVSPASTPAALQASGSGSFKHPPGCSTTACTYALTWTASPYPAFVDLDLQTCDATTGYVAVGFSKTGSMTDSSMIACVADRSAAFVQILVRQMYSSGHTTPVPVSMTNIVNLATSSADGCTRCIFSWNNTIAVISKESGLFDLNLPYYLVVARGGLLGDVLLKHSEPPAVSTVQYALLSSSHSAADYSSTGQQPLTSNSTTNGSGCLHHRSETIFKLLMLLPCLGSVLKTR